MLHMLPDGTKTDHAGYVRYLFDGARRWLLEPNGGEQSARVTVEANAWAALDGRTCPVCSMVE